MTNKKLFLSCALAVCSLGTTQFAAAAGAKAPSTRWGHLDPRGAVPKTALKQALAWFEDNEHLVVNKNYLTVFDLSKHSGQDRFYVIDLRSGAVESLHASHGNGSDTDNDGVVERLSNTPGSKMSSVGAALTGSMWWDDSANRNSLWIDGKENTNSNMRSRYIVIHPANYVNEDSNRTGRSEGCPALDPRVADRVMRQIAGKSVFYAWHPSYN